MPQVDKHKMVILNQEAETQTARTEKLAFLSTMCSVSLRKLETGQVEDKKKKAWMLNRHQKNIIQKSRMAKYTNTGLKISINRIYGVSNPNLKVLV